MRRVSLPEQSSVIPLLAFGRLVQFGREEQNYGDTEKYEKKKRQKADDDSCPGGHWCEEITVKPSSRSFITLMVVSGEFRAMNSRVLLSVRK